MQHFSLLWIFLAIFLGSCAPTVVTEGPPVRQIDSEEVSRLVIFFSKQMEVENRLFLEDSYATYNENIQQIILKYSSQTLLTFCEARSLIVDLVEGFLDLINSNPQLSGQLADYPFSAYNLDVRINFESYYGKYSDEQYMGLIWLQNGCVHFYAFERKDYSIDHDQYRFEPYFKSRELALLKKEADISFSTLNSQKKQSFYSLDNHEFSMGATSN